MSQHQGYGQFCPIARSAELIATRWTPLIVRELAFGSTRYAELRRGLPRISSALLSKPPGDLELAGIVTRRLAESASRPVYGLTEAGHALLPVLESMGRWAQAHSRDDMTRDENLGPDLLMWNIRRRVASEHVPAGGRFVAAFHFLGVPAQRSRFWLLSRTARSRFASAIRGRETVLAVTAHLGTMTRIWLGHLPLDQAVRWRNLQLEGDQCNVRAFSRWFPLSILADRNAAME